MEWEGRGEREAGKKKTGPEELMAAAFAVSFAMELARTMADEEIPVKRLVVDASCSMEAVESGYRVSLIQLDVRARAPGIDPLLLERLAAKAELNDPISNAVRGNLAVELHSELEPD
jgi:osmotically inducible protein OsmC